MKFRYFLLGSLLMVMLCGEASAQSSAISYQGSLASDGFAASGPFDFTFALFNAAANGTQVGVTVTNLNVQVTNGFFTTMMDFGTNSFLGSNRWVEVSVRTNGSSGAFSTLSPRQLVTPAPFALYALRAGSGLVGPAGQAGTNGAPGTTGQSASTVYGTGSEIITPSSGALTIPGLYQSLTVPTNCMVFISTDGNFRTTSTQTNGSTDLNIFISVDEAIPDTGGYTSLSSVYTGNAHGNAAHWALSEAVALSPGTNSFAVYAQYGSGANATVSGGNDTTDQGELTVMFLKQ